MRARPLPIFLVALLISAAWWVVWLVPWIFLGDIWLLIWGYPNLVGYELARTTDIPVASTRFVPIATTINAVLLFPIVAVLVWSKRRTFPSA